MVNSVEEISYANLFSSQALKDIPDGSFTIKTYNGVLDFIVQTFIIFFKARHILKKLKVGDEVAHLYFPVFHPWNYIFIRKAKKLGAKSILTIHDYYTHLGEKSIILEWIQRKTMLVADGWVFLTDHVRNQAHEALPQIKPTIVIPHPLLKVEKINQRGFSPKPKLLFLGRVKSYKGISNFLNALDGLKVDAVTIAGQGKLAINDSKIKRIDKYLSPAEITELLASHEILVLPYIDASQSGIIALATNAEIVMVISKLPGLKEQLPDDCAVWVDADSTSLHDGLKQLINGEVDYESIKSQIRHYKQQATQDWPTHVNRLINFIDQV